MWAAERVARVNAETRPILDDTHTHAREQYIHVSYAHTRTRARTRANGDLCFDSREYDLTTVSIIIL